jgi:N-acyl homoserine lactone hydrolase
MAGLRIRPITLSRVQAEKGVMTFLAYYGQKIWRPYTFWVIEGAGKNILVDTAAEADQYRGYHPGFKALPIEHLLSFEEALSKLSLKPDDIDLVVQTHLHFDHCFNTRLCKKAKVLVQEAELEFAMNPHPLFSLLYSRDLLDGIQFEPVFGDHELLPGIELIPVPGHTPGCQAVSVDTEAGKAVISGFCCVKENFFPADDIRERVSPFAGYPIMIPGIHYDAIKAYESVQKVKDIADIIIPNHEPELMDMEIIP